MDKKIDIFAPEIICRLDDNLTKILDYYTDYLRQNVQFNEIGSELHTKDHCARVLLLALMIAKEKYGDNSHILNALAHASIFHDSRRMDDNLDTGHGARAAAYYKEYCKDHDLEFIPAAALAMKYHDLDDRLGEAVAEKLDDEYAKTIFQIFKDADALDRFRMGRGGLDPKFLRNKESLKLQSFAYDLVKETVNASDFDAMERMIEEFKRLHKFNNMLLIVDPQYDFIDGTLPVPGAVQAMNDLAEYIDCYGIRYEVIVITADWHPQKHISFNSQGGEWPTHCVAFSHGASIYKPILDASSDICDNTYVLTKGTLIDTDEYSVVLNKESNRVLESLINDYGIGTIDMCGIAGDVCVLNTLRDMRKEYPHVKINVLTQYTASLDGGIKLKAEVDSEK